MREFAQVVDQLDESKKLINRGSLSDLRMALLLLDNAVELLAERKIRSKLDSNELWGRLLRTARNLPAGNAEAEVRKDEFIRDIQKHIIECNRRAAMRYFDEKFQFLKDCGWIEEPVPRVLKAIHRYRNEAYHRNKIRRETIRPVALLLFERACELLVTLRPAEWVVVEGEDDWSTFEQRFQL
jgi:hypothetical protein